MGSEAGALDWLLAFTLIATAAWSLAARDLYQAVVLFVSFGLLLALAWARLAAPDVAIAEAALGAGVTGALLLDALGALGARRRRRERASDG
jgi:energy-converting hydrogenase B subunit D